MKEQALYILNDNESLNTGQVGVFAIDGNVFSRPTRNQTVKTPKSERATITSTTNGGPMNTSGIFITCQPWISNPAYFMGIPQWRS